MSEKKLENLPRHDYFILPLISLVTVLVMLGGAEIVARQWFVVSNEGSCGVPDALHGYRFAANCICYSKAAEGPNVQYKFNECGYRSDESCAAKPAGAIRVALMGASTAEGFKASYQKAFATLAAGALAAQCHKPVEFQNMGVAGYKPIDQYWKVDEALAMKPDMVMLVVTPYELVSITDPNVLANRRDPEALIQKNARTATTHAPVTLVSMLDAALADSRVVLAAQHLLYQSREKYVSLFLMHGDKADYLRTPLTAAWEKRLEVLDLLLGEMADKIHAAGLPFALVVGPQRIQVSLLSPEARPPGIDPFMIGRRLAEIAARHGIIFYDSLDAFKSVPEPEQLFYPVDGHMTEAGHALFASAIEQELLTEKQTPFGQCATASLTQR
ncbi:MAG: SGNH/GDSL hydrolase family protein [Methylococcales bacterium]|nr:SGNH/GDSL hydrolase family protein [Methylococcales bacterium]